MALYLWYKPPSDPHQTRAKNSMHSVIPCLLQVTVELKNDLAISGTLHSVDQYLNIKLTNVHVINETKYPHMVSLIYPNFDPQQVFSYQSCSMSQKLNMQYVRLLCHLPLASTFTLRKLSVSGLAWCCSGFVYLQSSRMLLCAAFRQELLHPRIGRALCPGAKLKDCFLCVTCTLIRRPTAFQNHMKMSPFRAPSIIPAAQSCLLQYFTNTAPSFLAPSLLAINGDAKYFVRTGSWDLVPLLWELMCSACAAAGK